MRTLTTADVFIQSLNAPVQVGDAADVCAISEQEVHVWTVNLTRVPVLDEVLSHDEHERAEQLNSEDERRRFKAARSALRTILSRYIELPASSFIFGQTEFGKPFVVNSEADGLLFNLSRSGDVVTIAVTRNREVGIDVESVRHESDSMDIAEQCFSVAEIYTLTGLDQDARTAAFFNCWTRKEAYTKARGEGRSVPWVQFDMSVAPGVKAAMLNNRIDKEELARWVFQDLRLPPGYTGTLVFESLRTQPRLSCFAFGW
ncbi:MAG TPA: 4'-phosphopantetheinyl transferase superfamily protein [Pyrinomonadaceae bacterium]|nr:4'-phosphopantetheinyl transferase superfamily protein [Pyrinomonadaceae bacterium]